MMLSETLVENAVAHAPPSTEVTASISANAAFSVADRGRVFPPNNGNIFLSDSGVRVGKEARARG
jgi:hypothetical protein